MSFAAEYNSGVCQKCDGGIFEGQQIERFVRSGAEPVWQHTKCPDTSLEPPEGNPLCARCFTYHKGECL